MLFLDLLWLFFCIVLLNARPIFKSAVNDDIPEDVTDLNTKYISMERQYDHHDRSCNEYNKQTKFKCVIPITLFSRNDAKFKRQAESKYLNIKDFETLKNIQDYQKYDTNVIQSQNATTESVNSDKIYGYDDKSITNEDNIDSNTSDNYASVNLMDLTTEHAVFMGTAEIEAILNEIKHREIQMIAEHEPSVSDLISSTVTETTFVSSYHPKLRKMFPNFAISTILSLDRHNKIIIESTSVKYEMDDDKMQNNIHPRSLKQDATTLAYNIENMLQKKCKSVYNKIKKKLSNDCKKVTKAAKTTIKESIHKMCDKTTPKPKQLTKTTKKLHKNITTTAPMRNPVTKTTTVKKLNYTRNLKKNKLNSTLHSIPVLSDDYSMLSVFELLLTKTHENNMINVLSTKNYPIKREVKSEKYVENTSKDKNNFQVSDYANDDYNYNGTTNSYEQNDHYDAVDSSFESLSNKISYNDYVNGFKYYLNSQKDPDDLRFSNIIRYQAHKHHKVDDIGKYILNKIPQLPTTRLKRKFVETETLDDQDISTKSEDSWFKKHFFIFLDKDTPKKFHSAQTVTFRDFNTQLNKITKNSNNIFTTDLYVVNNNITTPTTPLIPIKSNSGFTNKSIGNLKKYYKRNSIGLRDFDKKRRRKRNLDHAKKTQDFKTTLNSKKIGVVDIDSVQVTSVTENPRKYNNKIVNYMLPKFRKSNYERKKGKRETDLRVPRFNIFKTFKGTRKVSAKQSTGRQHLFDYEILSDVNKSERNNNNDNIKSKQKDEYENNRDSKYENAFRIDDIVRQIPNISIDFPTMYPIRTVKYNNIHVATTRSEDYHHNMLHNEKLGTYHLTNNYLDLQDKRTVVFKDKIDKYLENLEDDSINVNYKSALHLPNNYDKHYFATFPSFSTMTKDSIGEEIEKLKSRITSFDAENGKKDATSIDSNNYGRLGGNEVIIKAYPYKQSLLNNNSPKVTKYSRDYKQYLKDFNTLDPNDIDWLINNLKHELNKNKLTSNVNKGHNPQKTTKYKNKTKTSKPKLSHKHKDLMNATVTKPNKKSDKDRVYNKKEKIKPNDKKSHLIFDLMHNDEPVSYTEAINTHNFDDMYLLKFTKSFQPKENVKPEGKVNDNFVKDNLSNAKNNLKNKNQKSNKKAGIINTPPEQYLKTPIPMEMNEFNKFLRDESIDVLSVTSPLRDTVSKIVESRKTTSKRLSSFHILEEDLTKSTCNAFKREQDDRNLLMKKMPSYNTDYIDRTTVKPTGPRSTDIFKDNRVKFISLKSLLTNSGQAKSTTSMSVPKIVQMRGESYKYDIIFNALNNRNQDLDYDSGIALSAYRNINNNELAVDGSLEDRQRSRKAVRTKNIPANFIENSRVKYDNWSNLVKKKHSKRDLNDHKCFTAKDVAALEVIVDLMKSTPGLEGNKKTKEYSRSYKNNSYTPLLERGNQLNSIQIHIAIPPNAGDRRRSMDSVNFRKVFSAVLSTPVDLQYQILTFDETTIAPTTTMQNILSPGLYLLVENTNTTFPKGNYVLKPLSLIEASNLNISHKKSIQSKAIDSMNNTISLLLNNNQTKKYNLTTDNYTKCKRNVNMVHMSKNCNSRKNIAVKKRNLEFNAVKRFFGHDRVCQCRCKVNKPMCKSCAESDKVITELMFEFNNLEKYVTDHCTEVQTFFWMNPAGGKKLRSVIHRIDRCLKDYYKRVKGKCQGRTCQMISSNIDKRSLRVSENDHQLLKNLIVLFNNLQNIAKCHVDNENIFLSGQKSLNTINNCLMKHMYKRSFTNNDEEIPAKSFYSLNNVKINLICNKDSTPTAYLPKDNYFGTNTEMGLYYDITGIEKEKQKGLKTFFRKFSCRRKSKKKKADSNTKNMKSNVQIKDPLLQKEEHSLFNYFNGYKKYKRMSDFHLESAQKTTTFDGPYKTTRPIKSDNSTENVSSSRQNVIKDFKLSDFIGEQTRSNAISINITSTTLKISSPILLSSKTNKDVNSTTERHQSRTNFTKASNKLSTTTSCVQKYKTKLSNNLIKNATSSNIKSNNVKITNSSRAYDKKVVGQKRNYNVLKKLKHFTLKCLKDSSHTKRNQNHVNRAIFIATLPKKYVMTTTMKYSEVKNDFLTDDTSPNSPTIIIFDDTPTPPNNQEYFDIDCLLVKKDMKDKENDPLNKPSYKSMDNIPNNIQLNSLIELDSQKPILDNIVSGTNSNDHNNNLHDKLSKDLSPKDSSTEKKSRGLLDKIAEKFVLKILPEDKHVVKSNIATSTTVKLSKQGKEQKPLHLNDNEQQKNRSASSTTKITVFLST